MFENVDGRTTDGRTTDGRTTDGRTTDTRVTGILIAHLGAFGSGELIIKVCSVEKKKHSKWIFTFWKQLKRQILDFTVSIATPNCMQNTHMQYLAISFICDRYFKHLRN